MASVSPSSNPVSHPNTSDTPHSPNLQDIKVGFYYTVRDTHLKRRSILDVGTVILNGSGGLDAATQEARRLYILQEQAYRAAGSPERPDRRNPDHSNYYAARDAYRVSKANMLPAFTGSGIFESRTDESLIDHSGLIGVDLDHVARSGLDVEEIRAACAEKPFTAMVFLSPSGDGVKPFALVTPVPGTDAEHRRAWEEVVAAYSDVAPVDVSDPSAKNASRLCLLAHDPGIVIKAIKDVVPLEVDLGEVPGAPPPSSHPAEVYHGDHDRRVDREALRHIPPPDDYDEWLGWLPTLKALRFTVDEVETWSSQGPKYRPDEVATRWAGLPEDPEDEARDKVRGHAYYRGWRQDATPPRKKGAPVHRLAEMRSTSRDGWVWVMDSERDADRLAEAGLTAVSSASRRWTRSASKALRGRLVAVAPTNDSAAINTAAHVANSVAPFAAEVRIVLVDAMPEGGSMCDFLEQGGTTGYLQEMLEQAVEYVKDPEVEVEGDEDVEPEEPRWKVSPLLGDAKLLTRLMKKEGYFVDARDEAYYFDETNHKLVPLYEDDKSLIILLGERYDLNRRDQLYMYLLAHLLREAYVRGIKANVRRFSFFDKEARTVYLDMGAGDVLKITPDAIEQRRNGEDQVLFLPMHKHEPWRYTTPKENDMLYRHFIEPVNFRDNGELDVPQQRALFLAWLLCMSFESIMPTKVLAAAVGPSGSGKSTLFRHAGKILISPRFQVSAMSKQDKGEENFFVKLKHSFLCCFDNIDESVRWLPDALAQISTGIERPGRALYTDDQLLETEVSCMVALTSRTPRMCLRREDVASRTLLFNLGELAEVRPEYDMEAEIKSKRDEFMSDYARLLQRVLAQPLDDVKPTDPSMRMADFARIATWIGRGLGQKRGEVMDRAIANISRVQRFFAVEQDPLAAALEIWLTRTQPVPAGAMNLAGDGGDPNEGRRVAPRHLFQELNSIAKEFRLHLPVNSPDALGKYISTNERPLRERFQIENGRKSGSRWWAFAFRDDEGDGTEDF